MNSAVLLYTMRCNISCEHCSVSSHPKRTEKMPLERAVELAKGLCRLPGLEFIDISGGEPMLYKREILEIARAVKEEGKSVRIVTNGFWARTPEKAVEHLCEMRDAGVSSVGVSIDTWHLKFLDPQLVNNYVEGCRAAGLVPFLSCVIGGAEAGGGAFPESVRVLLRRYGVDEAECVHIQSWAVERAGLGVAARREFDREFGRRHILIAWQYLTGEGEARSLPVLTVPFADTPPEPCDAAGHLPTVDEAGRLYPCCSPWVSRKEHAMGVIDRDSAAGAVGGLLQDPYVRVLHTYGPKELIDVLRRRGVSFPDEHSGICNQCGILMDRLSLDELRSVSAELLNYKKCLSILGIGESPREPLKQKTV